MEEQNKNNNPPNRQNETDTLKNKLPTGKKGRISERMEASKSGFHQPAKDELKEWKKL